MVVYGRNFLNDIAPVTPNPTPLPSFGAYQRLKDTQFEEIHKVLRDFTRTREDAFSVEKNLYCRSQANNHGGPFQPLGASYNPDLGKSAGRRNVPRIQGTPRSGQG